MSNFEEKENLKFQIIKEIHSAGLDVVYIIHRHGMDEKTAFEVEGALIDAYAGLSNKMNGHYSSDFGVSSAVEINNLYTKKEFNEIAVMNNDTLKFIIIKVRNSTIDSLFGSLDERLYEATRGNWRLSLSNANKYKYVLCVVDGIVKEVYEVETWNPVRNEPGRFYFNGKVASDKVQKLFKNYKIPFKYRKKGSATPVLYYQP